jgi:hypothetical protein
LGLINIFLGVVKLFVFKVYIRVPSIALNESHRFFCKFVPLLEVLMMVLICCTSFEVTSQTFDVVFLIMRSIAVKFLPQSFFQFDLSNSVVFK